MIFWSDQRLAERYGAVINSTSMKYTADQMKKYKLFFTNWQAIRSSLQDSEKDLVGANDAVWDNAVSDANCCIKGLLNHVPNDTNNNKAIELKLGSAAVEVLRLRQGAVFEAARRLKASHQKRALTLTDFRKSMKPGKQFAWNTNFLKFVIEEKENLKPDEALYIGSIYGRIVNGDPIDRQKLKSALSAEALKAVNKLIYSQMTLEMTYEEYMSLSKSDQDKLRQNTDIGKSNVRADLK